MSEDNTTVVVTDTLVAEKLRGERGELGVATASLTLKQRWHTEHFKLVDTSNHEHPNRQSYVAKPGAPSLRAFARTLLKSGDANAKEWFANKAGAKNQARSAANVQLAKTCASATKMGRKKSKSGGGKAKTAEATA
jgi:hypothetical protein